VCQGSSADLCNTCTAKTLQEAQNKHGHVRGIRVLTPLHSALQRNAARSAQQTCLCQRIRVLTSAHAVHCKGALQEAQTNMGSSCARGSGADSSATQCTARTLQEAQEQTGSCAEDQIDSSATQCTTKTLGKIQSKHGQLCQRIRVLTPPATHTTKRCKKHKTNMDCARGSEC
jgi:hypothetical protein